MYCSNKIYDDSSCGICKDEYNQAKENKWMILVCGHLFHQACIEPWVENQPICPTCRAEHIEPYSGLLKEISKATYKRILECRSVVIDTALLISVSALPILIAVADDVPKICREMADVDCQTLGFGLLGIGLFAEVSLSTYYLIKGCLMQKAQIISYKPICI